MSKSTISTFQLLNLFPDEQSAYDYVDEFTFRLNAGKVQRHTTERLDSFVSAVVGKRLTYERLTKGSTWFDANGVTCA